ncbi:MAG TPA: hypothetical protein VLI04_05465 [Nocardioidaceae bacterium]|nr:hypothetical protein [Nocardioidaceae bacterium]
MSNTWDQLRARNSVVTTIVTRAADGVSAGAAWTGVAGVWDHFDDESHLLRELQQHWFHSLAASVDNALEMGDGNLVDDVRKAYRSAADRHRNLRRILDEYAHHPALEPLVRREHSLLASAAGVEHSDEITKVVVAVPQQRKVSFIARFFNAA